MLMIVSDYDDTFYINDTDIKKNVKAANEFIKQNIFCIATGRSITDFTSAQNEHQIPCSYLIADHGSLILKDHQILYQKCIDNNILPDLMNDLRLDRAIESFSCQLTEKKESIDPQGKDFNKLHIYYGSSDIALQIMQNITSKYQNYITAYLVTDLRAIEIVSIEANKSQAISFIAELENITKENIYTIGDSFNDIEMIKNFNGYASPKAVDALKTVAIKQLNSVSQLIELVSNSN